MPGELALPSHARAARLRWLPATAPGTVAQALLAAGQWDLTDVRDFDDTDWWYRCSFAVERPADGIRHVLRFRGLATLAEVWLNDRPILTADNMFREHAVDVTGLVSGENELVVCFRSINKALARPRPRPRWKTKLVDRQQLRWIRTTLLGRMPGWTPAAAPVGPWRDVILETGIDGTLSDVELRPALHGDAGVVDVSCHLRHRDRAAVEAEVVVGGHAARLSVEREPLGYLLHGRLRIDDVVRWWPHTHGTPHLYPCSVRMMLNGRPAELDCGPIGFRRIDALQDGGTFELLVNGIPVFCRGACWSVNDIVTLSGSAEALANTLELVRSSGANMLRVGGTMVYEQDAFYQACDRLGIMVWQDFMFANMDYPAGDEAFLDSVTMEAAGQLRRFRRHACVSIYCGNSEVEQQAAMLGVAEDVYRGALFSRVLPELCRRWHPDTPFVASTPTGGAMPFHVGSGIAHYYGVGAYRRPLTDVRRARVRFASECLGFANVPDQSVVDHVMNGEMPATHDPRWKRGTPRDRGAGWDFDDVRDHYLRELYSVDPERLRAVDPSRYLDLGRVTTGEIMSQVFAEWRSRHSDCHGGLVWFLKDLRPGAGWGILDSRGWPKACFYYLRRAWQPQAVLLTDEGLDGIHVHVVNDTDRPLEATLELTLLRDGRVVTAHGSMPCRLDPRARATYGSDILLGTFYDVAYAYRFGPLSHDVVAASLRAAGGELIGESFWFPRAEEPTRFGVECLRAESRGLGSDRYEVTLRAGRFVQAVHLDAAGYLPDDNYFHLMPDTTKTVRFEPVTETPLQFAASVDALSLEAPMPVHFNGR
jgi:beta-mannosidase